MIDMYVQVHIVRNGMEKNLFSNHYLIRQGKEKEKKNQLFPPFDLSLKFIFSYMYNNMY